MKLGLLAALALLISLAVYAPARLIAYLLPPEQMVLQAFRGSLWDGHANRAMLRTGAGYLHLGALSWELNPWSLLTLAPRLKLHSEWADQRLSSRVTLRGRGSVDFKDMQITASASLIRHILPLSLSGRMEGQFQELKIRDELPVYAVGRLLWRDGSWRAPQGEMRLGSYGLDVLTDKDGALRGEIVSIAGPVEAVGTVSLTGPVYELDVRVSAGAAMQESLQQALSLVASPDEGGYRMALQGNIRG
jgi:hypothetical protein